jgi:hypothetical protein
VVENPKAARLLSSWAGDCLPRIGTMQDKLDELLEAVVGRAETRDTLGGRAQVSFLLCFTTPFACSQRRLSRARAL